MIKVNLTQKPDKKPKRKIIVPVLERLKSMFEVKNIPQSLFEEPSPMDSTNENHPHGADESIGSRKEESVVDLIDLISIPEDTSYDPSEDFIPEDKQHDPVEDSLPSDFLTEQSIDQLPSSNELCDEVPVYDEDNISSEDAPQESSQLQIEEEISSPSIKTEHKNMNFFFGETEPSGERNFIKSLGRAAFISVGAYVCGAILAGGVTMVGTGLYSAFTSMTSAQAFAIGSNVTSSILGFGSSTITSIFSLFSSSSIGTLSLMGSTIYLLSKWRGYNTRKSITKSQLVARNHYLEKVVSENYLKLNDVELSETERAYYLDQINNTTNIQQEIQKELHSLDSFSRFLQFGSLKVLTTGLFIATGYGLSTGDRFTLENFLPSFLTISTASVVVSKLMTYAASKNSKNPDTSINEQKPQISNMEKLYHEAREYERKNIYPLLEEIEQSIEQGLDNKNLYESLEYYSKEATRLFKLAVDKTQEPSFLAIVYSKIGDYSFDPEEKVEFYYKASAIYETLGVMDESTLYKEKAQDVIKLFESSSHY